MCTCQEQPTGAGTPFTGTTNSTNTTFVFSTPTMTIDQKLILLRDLMYHKSPNEKKTELEHIIEIRIKELIQELR